MKRLAFALLLFSVYINVGAQTVSNLTPTGFTATWAAVATATHYEIDVYTKQNASALNVAEGFAAGTAAPAGWEFNVGGTYTNVLTDCGAAAPSLSLKSTGQYVITPETDQNITEFSFWAKGQTTDANSSIVVGVKARGKWAALPEVKPIATTGQTLGENLIQLGVTGVTQLRIEYTKSAGNLALDDVCYKTDGVKRTYLAAYDAKNIGNVLSYTVTGLTTGTTYYFSVRAYNGTTQLQPESEKSVTPQCEQHAYYGNMCEYTSLSGADLKTKLHNKIKGHTTRTYDNLWTDFEKTDKRSSGKVWDMYSTCTFTFGKTSKGGHQDPGTSTSTECTYFNREHSFPKAWMREVWSIELSESDTSHNDLFHVYPTDKVVNARRDNWAFGTVGVVQFQSNNNSKVGTCNYPGYAGVVFEPADEYKGDFARTYFYMVTRYEHKLNTWYNSFNGGNKQTLNGSSYPAFTDWTKKMLLEWHKEDPVSQKEIDRNNTIYGIQKNRNPFVDFPDLVEKIWTTSTGGATSVASEKAATLKVYPNPVSSTLNVGMPEVVAMEYSIYAIGGAMLQKGVTQGTVNVSGLANGNYFIVLSGKNQYSAQFVKGD